MATILVFSTIFVLILHPMRGDIVANDAPLVDFLIEEYLSVEKSLWYDIEQHNDQQVLFGRICEAHERFLNADFGETNILEIISDSPKTFGIIKDNINRIKGTFQLAAQHINSRHHSTLDDIINNFVRDYSVSTLINALNIHREVIRADFWEKCKRVSEQSINRLVSMILT